MTEVRVRAPAKVNLFLRVLAREASGYHRIETLFQGLALHDRLRIRRVEEPEVRLRVEGDEDLGPAQGNLAVRAARAYRRRAGLEEAPGVDIRLRKAIPAGAGLGGGSSDGAAVLRALDRIHEGAVPPADLLELGAGLGSDVPFFLGRSALALGWGRGERLLELPALPVRPAVVAVPAFRVSTGVAYERLGRRREAAGEWNGARPAAMEVADLTSWKAVVERSGNDFQETVFQAHPLCRKVRDALADAGGSPALLSGSGSALFAVYAHEAEADAAAARIRESFGEVEVLRTRTLASFGDLLDAGR